MENILLSQLVALHKDWEIDYEILNNSLIKSEYGHMLVKDDAIRVYDNNGDLQQIYKKAFPAFKRYVTKEEN